MANATIDEARIGEPTRNILYCVAAWFAGFRFTIHGQKKFIGTHYEPTLRQLCASTGRWSQQYDQVHKAMKSRGLFKSEARDEDIYIAGRRCEWLPTEKCMRLIEDIYEGEESLRPSWVTDEHTGPPVYRDGPELMEHRKGTIIAAHALAALNPNYSTELYPQVKMPHRPDVRLYGSKAHPLARVEVLTNHENTETWETKFSAWNTDEAWPTVWLYENRSGMVKFWNHMVRNGYVELDGGRFGGEANNWSPTRVNDRLQRSREGPQDYASHDVCWTIPGMLRADVVEVLEWAKEYGIK